MPLIDSLYVSWVNSSRLKYVHKFWSAIMDLKLMEPINNILATWQFEIEGLFERLKCNQDYVEMLKPILK